MSITTFFTSASELYFWWISELSGIFSLRGFTVVVEDSQTSLRWENEGHVETLARKFTAQDAVSKYLSAIEINKKLRVNSCAIELPLKKVLRKTITLPAATEENLDNVIGFELDRYTPFKREDVYFDVKVQHRDPGEGRITVQLSVIKRSVIDEIVAFVQQQELSLRGIFARSLDNKEEAEFFHFLKEGQSAQQQRESSGITSYLWKLVFLLAIVALFLPIVKNYLAAEDLTMQLQAMDTDVQAVRKLQDDYKSVKEDAEFLINQTSNTVPVVELLAKLSTVIPNDTSLTRFELESNRVRINGTSSAASRLISILDQFPTFSDVRFAAPVTQNSKTGKESFTIEFVLKGGE